MGVIGSWLLPGVGLVAAYWLWISLFLDTAPASVPGAVLRTLSPVLAVIFILSVRADLRAHATPGRWLVRLLPLTLGPVILGFLLASLGETMSSGSGGSDPSSAQGFFAALAVAAYLLWMWRRGGFPPRRPAALRVALAYVLMLGIALAGPGAIIGTVHAWAAIRAPLAVGHSRYRYPMVMVIDRVVRLGLLEYWPVVSSRAHLYMRRDYTVEPWSSAIVKDYLAQARRRSVPVSSADWDVEARGSFLSQDPYGAECCIHLGVGIKVRIPPQARPVEVRIADTLCDPHWRDANQNPDAGGKQNPDAGGWRAFVCSLGRWPLNRALPSIPTAAIDVYWVSPSVGLRPLAFQHGAKVVPVVWTIIFDLYEQSPRRSGAISVIIVSVVGFDVTKRLDRATLTFGRTGDEASLLVCDDWVRNGRPDLLCHFDLARSGLAEPINTGAAVLKGRTYDGMQLRSHP